MKRKYIGSHSFDFKGVEISVMYYFEDGLYYGTITHLIKEPNGNIYKPGGGTSMDLDLEHLKYKLTKVYLSNFYDGCQLIPNDNF